MVPNGNGYYKIINSNSNKALETDTVREIVVQSGSIDDSSQLWTLEPIFDHLTLVGPASPTGSWTRPEGTDATDYKERAFCSNIWTFTGYLNLGEIKIYAKAGGFVSGS